MSAFSFPPPPPPPSLPPQLSATSQPPQNQRGGFNNRGRGRGRGGNHRGGFNPSGHPQHHSSFRPQNQAPPAPSGYPLPNYPTWIQSGAQQSPPSYQTAQPMNPNPYPSYNVPQPQYHAPQPVQQTYYGQTHQPMAPYQNQSAISTNTMAPPVRMGFNVPHEHTYSTGHLGTSVNNKRKRDQPFSAPQNNTQPKPQTTPKLPAPPAIPSFGFSLPPKPPPVESASKKSKHKKRRKNNQLGLTPKGEVHEDSDEDVDEEALFAQSGQPLQIQHRGQSIQLNSSADVAAWIAERKKRFPTQAKVAERKAVQEVEKKKRQEEREKWQAKKKEERQKKDLERKQKKSKGRPEQHSRSASLQSTTTVKSTIERGSGLSPKTEIKEEPSNGGAMPEDPVARVAFLEEQLRLAKVAAARASGSASVEPTKLEQADAQSLTTIKEEEGAETSAPIVFYSAAASDGDTVTTEAPKIDLGLAYSTDDSGSMDESLSDISSEEPSSESDLESSSDAPPDEVTAKSQGPIRIPPPPREKSTKPKQVCKHYAKFGNCKFGKNCRLSHDVVPSTGKGAASIRSGSEKKKKILSLRERFIEQELREEAKLGLQVIKYLRQNKVI